MKSETPKGHENAAENFHNGTSNNPNNNGSNGHDKAAENVPFLDGGQAGTVVDFDSAEVSDPGTKGLTTHYTTGDMVVVDAGAYNTGTPAIRDGDGDGDLEFSTTHLDQPDPTVGLMVQQADGDTFEFVDVTVDGLDSPDDVFTLYGFSLAHVSYDNFTISSEYDDATGEFVFHAFTMVEQGNQVVQEDQVFETLDEAIAFAADGVDVQYLSVMAYGVDFDDFVFA